MRRNMLDLYLVFCGSWKHYRQREETGEIFLHLQVWRDERRTSDMNFFQVMKVQSQPFPPTVTFTEGDNSRLSSIS
uniref:Uncharacterized protein n=2 Tax=Anguilla anguilla TaxID=7936 RepID=A0A0E9PPD8_ANGAN